jgi:hypothetical protein
MQNFAELVGSQVGKGHVKRDAEGHKQVESEIAIGFFLNLADVGLADVRSLGQLTLRQPQLTSNSDQVSSNVSSDTLLHVLDLSGRRRPLCWYTSSGCGSHSFAESSQVLETPIAYPESSLQRCPL